MPADGLPHMQSWLGTAESILKGGYDSSREVIEVKAEVVFKKQQAFFSIANRYTIHGTHLGLIPCSGFLLVPCFEEPTALTW